MKKSKLFYEYIKDKAWMTISIFIFFGLSYTGGMHRLIGTFLEEMYLLLGAEPGTKPVSISLLITFMLGLFLFSLAHFLDKEELNG